ncbi:Hypothetical protein FORC18_3213 [Vibrio parahaemolyticus]|nr:hypothetical protein FORC8_3206 [Vibrio parahaemolyticus]APE85826.1 Hypothetical protein FORC18_3213 [Vibrio parahaemolyticus]
MLIPCVFSKVLLYRAEKFKRVLATHSCEQKNENTMNAKKPFHLSDQRACLYHSIQA